MTRQVDPSGHDSGSGIDRTLVFKSPTLDGFKLLDMVAADGSQEVEPGTFSGYLARYGNLDDNGDVISPGAFADSIATDQSAGKMPHMLLNHAGIPWGAVTPESLMPVGVWTSMHEDTKGLAVTGKIDPMNTDTGRKIYAGMKNGSLNGLSIGYRAQDFVRGSKAGEPKRLITKAKLFEGSIVLMPANEMATIDNVKSMFQSIVDQAKSSIDEDFDPRNVRHLDKLLREAGLSRAETKSLLAIGFKSLSHQTTPRDAGATTALSGLLAELKSAR